MKDPAFLFYPSDFLSGTMFFTDEQLGKYIRLLCVQHQYGGSLTENQMNFICKSYDNDVWSKFQKLEDGTYRNERLYLEMTKRQKYCESRGNNKRGKTKDDDMKIISKSYDNHMGDINRDIDIDIKEDKKDEKKETWKTSYELYMSECKYEFDRWSNDTNFINQQSRLNPNVDVRLSIEKSFINFWGTEAGWENKKKSKSKSINWKLTIVNAIEHNKVYYPRNTFQPTIQEIDRQKEIEKFKRDLA